MFFVGLVHAGSYYPFGGWRTINTPHFSIQYHQNIEEIAKRSADYFEEAYTILKPKFQWEPWGRTQVILIDNNDDANGLATTLPYNMIILRIVPPDPESSLNTYDDWLKTLITHELTHILHLDAYGGFWKPWHYVFGKLISPAALTPNWVKEGLAVLQETEETKGGRGRASYSEMLVRTAVLNKQFPSIDRADGLQWKWPAGQTQYIFGVKFLMYLEKRFGWEKLQVFNRVTQRNFLISAVNHAAKKAFGVSLYQLWRDWQKELGEKYAVWDEKIKSEGMTQLEPFLGGKDSYYLPTFSRDGKKLAYVTYNPRKATMLWLKDLETGKVEKLSDKTPTQISFSPDDKSIVFASMGTFKRYQHYLDLYQIDLETKKLTRLTKGERARDPDFMPDGKRIVFVSGEAGKDVLKIYDVETKSITTLLSDVKPFTQFANLRYSPDGAHLALVRFQKNVGWELCIFAADATSKPCIKNNGIHVNSRPEWTPDGRWILFVSDEDGTNNLYAYEWRFNKLQRVSRVETGLFEPAISKNDQTLLGRYYTGEGYEIRKVPLQLKIFGEDYGPETMDHGPKTKKSGKKKDEKKTNLPSYEKEENSKVGEYAPQKYNPFGKSLFLPRFLLPGVNFLGDSFLFTAFTGGADPLRYHNWMAGGSFRTDANYFGYTARYYYNRYAPIMGIGIDDQAVDYGTLVFSNSNSYRFFEQRRNASAFLSVPVGTKQAFGFSYFYEDRIPITHILPSEANALNLGVFAGINMSYTYGEGKSYPASISHPEKGRILRLNGTITDKRLLSADKNEQRIFAGDFRQYIPLWANQVLALRAAGGIAFGDQIFPGTFTLGGALGEGALATGYSSRYFNLRGLPVAAFVKDRAMLLSGEYRFPLVSPQRGIGTWPVFLKDIHVAAFADFGDAWNTRDPQPRNFSKFFDPFMLGIGGELRGDFVLGHGLPLSGRLGYGIIVRNRARLVNLKDPILGTLAKNGILILQFGTSF
ncbi:MAG: PD40 domain-containing protein [Deltaproteobacteria bacterium]|nr:PD40 domain-containing protein [Deltaproteobacteria bacterium]